MNVDHVDLRGIIARLEAELAAELNARVVENPTTIAQLRQERDALKEALRQVASERDAMQRTLLQIKRTVSNA